MAKPFNSGPAIKPSGALECATHVLLYGNIFEHECSTSLLFYLVGHAISLQPNRADGDQSMLVLH
jgi:hypothetical protein